MQIKILKEFSDRSLSDEILPEPYSTPLLNAQRSHPSLERQIKVLLVKQRLYDDYFLFPGLGWLFRKSSLLVGYWRTDKKAINSFIRCVSALGCRMKKIKAVPVGTQIFINFLFHSDFPGISDPVQAFYGIRFHPDRFGYYITKSFMDRFPVVSKVDLHNLVNPWEKYFFLSLSWVIEELMVLFDAPSVTFKQYLTLYPTLSSFGLIFYSLALVLKGKPLPSFISLFNLLHSYLLSCLESNRKPPTEFFIPFLLSICSKHGMLPYEFGLPDSHFVCVEV